MTQAYEVLLPILQHNTKICMEKPREITKINLIAELGNQSPHYLYLYLYIYIF